MELRQQPIAILALTQTHTHTQSHTQALFKDIEFSLQMVNNSFDANSIAEFIDREIKMWMQKRMGDVWLHDQFCARATIFSSLDGRKYVYVLAVVWLWQSLTTFVACWFFRIRLQQRTKTERGKNVWRGGGGGSVVGRVEKIENKLHRG